MALVTQYMAVGGLAGRDCSAKPLAFVHQMRS